MLKDALSAPKPGEYAPYYTRSIKTVADMDVRAVLKTQRAQVAALATLSDDQAKFRYIPGKWSVKEVIGHMSDTERVFAYRALRFAREDTTPLPGFEQDAYVATGHFDKRPVAEICTEFVAVRESTLTLIGSFVPEVFLRRGVASNAKMTVRALIYLIAGHAEHHLQLLKERYGV